MNTSGNHYRPIGCKLSSSLSAAILWDSAGKAFLQTFKPCVCRWQVTPSLVDEKPSRALHSLCPVSTATCGEGALLFRTVTPTALTDVLMARDGRLYMMMAFSAVSPEAVTGDLTLRSVKYIPVCEGEATVACFHWNVVVMSDFEWWQ